MYMLQLFDQADEIQPIDARLIRDGAMMIGRGNTADWTIADPNCELSRTHCELAVVAEGLRLRVLGANGVFDDMTGERLPDESAIPIPSTMRLGRFRLRAAHAGQSEAVDPNATMLLLTPPVGAAAVPDQWSDAASAPVTGGGTSMLEAFCDGAGLDASLLSSEDPVEVMRRAGEVYRQMVLGVGDLMAERDRARSQYKLSRTTIARANNNPFKWAPTQRLAVDLLLAGSGSFLSGPAALNASFRDLKRHLIGSFAGMRGSLRAAVAMFDPRDVDATVAPRVTMLKSRHALHAEETTRRHADLAAQIEGERDGALEQAFIAAYDAADRSE